MISISIWLRMKDESIGLENFIILSNLKKEIPQQTNYIGFGSIINNDNNVEFAYANLGSGFSIKDQSNILFDLNWHHLVGIFDQVNSELKFYIDNNLIFNVSPANLSSFSDLKFMNIGSSLYPQVNANIEIDDLRIYNRIISECEIENLFNETIQEISCEEPISGECEFITSNLNLESETTRIEVFPNPAKDLIRIRSKNLPPSQLWVLHNNLCQTIDQGMLTNNVNDIRLNNVPNGIYFLEVSGSAFKIVIQK